MKYILKLSKLFIITVFNTFQKMYYNKPDSLFSTKQTFNLHREFTEDW